MDSMYESELRGIIHVCWKYNLSKKQYEKMVDDLNEQKNADGNGFTYLVHLCARTRYINKCIEDSIKQSKSCLSESVGQ